MIALDTNVLVRFLVKDDEGQARRARGLISREAGAGRAMHVADVVLCELVWVLDVAYGFAREDIAGVLRRLGRTRELVFESDDRLARAVEAYQRGAGDFADYMILESARAASCDAVAPFDRALLKEEGFTAA